MKTQNNITVIIHTRNEESNIPDCINSAKILTDNIIVIDMESTDRTIDIAKKLGAEIKSFPFSHYVEPSREFGIRQAKTDWVFILDVDERMTSELGDEIGNIIASDQSLFTHFKVPRKNMFGQKSWLKHGGWWPDYQTRLIHLKSFNSWPKRIHSAPNITGNEGRLINPLIHFSHGNIEDMVNKTLVFEDIESDLLFNAGKPVSVLIFFRKFIGELFRRMFIKLGFLDGTAGIIESIYQAYSKTITYLFLYEKKSKRQKSKNSSTL